MFKSIGWTLQLWHAGILLAAMAGLGSTLYLTAYRTTYTQVDSELESAARVFAGPGVAQPAAAPRHRALNWLKTVPRDCLNRLGWDAGDQPYFIVWGADGSVIRSSDPTPAIAYPGKSPADVPVPRRESSRSGHAGSGRFDDSRRTVGFARRGKPGELAMEPGGSGRHNSCGRISRRVDRFAAGALAHQADQRRGPGHLGF